MQSTEIDYKIIAVTIFKRLKVSILFIIAYIELGTPHNSLLFNELRFNTILSTQCLQFNNSKN